MTRFDLKTNSRNELVEITDRVRDAVAASGVKSGLCVVYCPHTTAAITINENADPDVVHDMLHYLNKSIPQHQAGFRHGEGNSDSHIKASLVGPSVTLIVDGRFSLVTALLAGFGRAAAEVGAVIIVGGNIDGFTRTMTTAIALETSKGDLPLAIGLGLVLIAIVFVINALAWGVRRAGKRYAG